MNGLKKYGILTSLMVFGSVTTANAASDVYANFPITLKGYSGDAKTSESYGGQMARHMLHNGLKKAASSGDFGKMKMYFTLGKTLLRLIKVGKDFLMKIKMLLTNYLTQ